MNATTPTSWKNALTKYAKMNKHRRSASGKRLAQARYASDSHVVVTHAILDGVMMRIEKSKKWGVVTTQCNKEIK